MKDCEVLVWDRATFEDLPIDFHEFSTTRCSWLSDYVEWYMMVHVALSCHTARERFARVLASPLANAIGEKVPGGIEIDVTNRKYWPVPPTLRPTPPAA